MSEEFNETPSPAVKVKRRGWPRGKPRGPRQSREAPPVVAGRLVADAPSKPHRWTMKAGANWETNDMDVVEGVDKYHIPPEDIPEGMSLQWVADSIFGQPQPLNRAKFEKKGWTPVHPEDFGGIYDGRFTPKGSNKEINVDGLVLYARPKEITDRARAREKQAALNQVRLKEQALTGGDNPNITLDPRHPSALRNNRINRTMERLEIPRDEE